MEWFGTKFNYPQCLSIHTLWKSLPARINGHVIFGKERYYVLFCIRPWPVGALKYSTASLEGWQEHVAFILETFWSSRRMNQEPGKEILDALVVIGDIGR